MSKKYSILKLVFLTIIYSLALFSFAQGQDLKNSENKQESFSRFKPLEDVKIDKQKFPFLEKNDEPTWPSVSTKTSDAMKSNSSSESKDYYWIGGSGNWNDLGHWATTSGGTSLHTVVPSPLDDVYFDANSFTAMGQVVDFNTAINCKNMDWGGVLNTPEFIGGVLSQLNIYGSLTFTSDMILSNYQNGEIAFQAYTTGHTITSAGHTFKFNVAFRGQNGGWILQDDLNTTRNIGLLAGKLNTNSKTINADALSTHNDSFLELANSKLVVKSAFRAYSPLDAGTSEIRLIESNSNLATEGNLYDVIFEGSQGFLRYSHEKLISFNSVTFQGDGFISGNGEFNDLTFQGDGTIEETNTIDDLTFSSGGVYELSAEYTQTVNNFNATGNCSEYITILSSSLTEQAQIQKSSGILTADYLILKNIHASGGANFMANNSIDLGNNTGWTIQAAASRDLYWVDGTGDWNDPSHWSLTSGGTGGTCLPSPLDNVYFDANSFTLAGQMVNVNSEEVSCKNMDWSGVQFTPELKGDLLSVLNIHGSLILISDMFFSSYAGESINFKAITAGQKITSAGHTFNSWMNFSGQNGGWVLNDDLSVNKDINLISGNLNTNDKTITASNFFAYDDSFLDLTSSTVMLQEDLRTLGQLDAGTSEIRLKGSSVKTNSDLYNVIFEGNYGSLGYYFTDDTISFNNVTFQNDGNIRGEGEFNDLTFQGDGNIYGSNSFDNLTFSSGKYYELKNGSVQTVNNFNATGNCSEYIAISSTLSAEPAQIQKTNGSLIADYLILESIHRSGGADFIANNSIDLGNNVGWMISGSASQDLYWVGGSGDWSDVAHWSTSSGGMGGSCLPSPLDNVYFDKNSFTATGQVIGINTDRVTCQSMDWGGAQFIPEFKGDYAGQLNIHGSLTLIPDMIFNNYDARLTSFKSNTKGQTITSAGHAFNFEVDFDDPSGSWILVDDLSAGSYIRLRAGKLNTNNKTVTTNGFTAYNDSFLELGDSKVKLANRFFSKASSLDAGTSEILLTGANPFVYTANDLHDVIFERKHALLNYQDSVVSFNSVTFQGDGVILGTGQFNNLTFQGNGTILETNSFDTLTFSPGGVYKLGVDQTQTIDVWNARGVACYPISISSTIPGQQANVHKTSGTVNGSVLFIQDLNAMGGAEFYAGEGGADVGNNTNWNFSTATTHIDGFLGNDTPVCEGESLTLNAQFYYFNESYEWSTGETGASIEVTEPGDYWVKVSLGTDCELTDTVSVSFVPRLPEVDLGEDRNIANGEQVLLDGTVEGALTYLWQDGSTESTFVATVAGTYSVEVSNGTCIVIDEITLTFDPEPVLSLGENQTKCEGEELVLDATFEGATYLWNDGTTNATLSVTESGTYSVEVTNAAGTVRDEIMITFESPIEVNLGEDQALCGPGDLVLNATATGASYLWSNGSTAATLLVEDAGVYSVEVTNSCGIFTDEIEIYPGLPALDLGADRILCADEFVMDVTVDGEFMTYLWQDGSTNSTYTATNSGTYSVEISNSCGTVSDEIELIFESTPSFELGEGEKTCLGNNIVLDATVEGATYLWQDGSTNPSYTATSSGTYSVEVTNSCGTVSDEVELTFESAAVFELGENQTTCSGGEIKLDATFEGATYLWQDGSTNASYTASSSGTYSVAVTNTCGTVRDEIELTFESAADLNLGDDQAICTGNEIVLDATFEGATYLWQDGSTNPTYTGISSGTYSVEVTNSCGTVRDEIELVFDRPIELNLGEDQELCSVNEMILDASFEGATYLWQDGSTNSTYTATSSGTYSVEATNSCGTVRDEIELVLDQPVDVNLGDDQTICAGNEIMLDVTSDGASYLWQDGSTNPTFTIISTGVYSVEVTNRCGVSTDEIKVIQAPLNTFSYDQSAYCFGDGNPLPLLSTSDPVIFSSQHGLVLDGNTGRIDLENSDFGNYTIHIESDACFDNDQYEISIINLTIDNSFLVEVNDGNCTQGGQIEIDRSGISGGVPPYVISLTNIFDQERYILEDNKKKFTGLTQGKYELEVSSSGSCIASWFHAIEVHVDDHDCTPKVITPSAGETLTVSMGGSIQIYNHDGNLVTKFTGPGEWDARDQNGNLVPMGYYILISEENSGITQEVTVIR